MRGCGRARRPAEERHHRRRRQPQSRGPGRANESASARHRARRSPRPRAETLLHPARNAMDSIESTCAARAAAASTHRRPPCTTHAHRAPVSHVPAPLAAVADHVAHSPRVPRARHRTVSRHSTANPAVTIGLKRAGHDGCVEDPARRRGLRGDGAAWLGNAHWPEECAVWACDQESRKLPPGVELSTFAHNCSTPPCTVTQLHFPSIYPGSGGRVHI